MPYSEERRLEMIGHTANEQKLYGEKWSTVHGGYFADRAIAAPLVEAILDATAIARPSAIADLGGGTGFLLGEVLRRLDFDIKLSMVCVDTSRQQLDDCPDTMLTRECSVEEVERGDLVEPGGSPLLCTRSVLHYFGEKMLKPDLGHFRSMLEPGEYFVHQTICFESKKEQAVANVLYDRMDTGKWFPTVHFLLESLREERFELVDIRPAPPYRSPAPSSSCASIWAIGR